MDEKYTELAVKLQEVDSRGRSNEHRLYEHDARINEIDKKQDIIYDLASSVKSIAMDMSYVKEDVQEVRSGQKELNDKVSILENRPASETKKRLDDIYEKILWVVVGGIVVATLAMLFPNIPW